MINIEQQVYINKILKNNKFSSIFYYSQKLEFIEVILHHIKTIEKLKKFPVYTCDQNDFSEEQLNLKMQDTGIIFLPNYMKIESSNNCWKFYKKILEIKKHHYVLYLKEIDITLISDFKKIITGLNEVTIFVKNVLMYHKCLELFAEYINIYVYLLKPSLLTNIKTNTNTAQYDILFLLKDKILPSINIAEYVLKICSINFNIPTINNFDTEKEKNSIVQLNLNDIKVDDKFNNLHFYEKSIIYHNLLEYIFNQYSIIITKDYDIVNLLSSINKLCIYICQEEDYEPYFIKNIYRVKNVNEALHKAIEIIDNENNEILEEEFYLEENNKNISLEIKKEKPDTFLKFYEKYIMNNLLNFTEIFSDNLFFKSIDELKTNSNIEFIENKINKDFFKTEKCYRIVGFNLGILVSYVLFNTSNTIYLETELSDYQKKICEELDKYFPQRLHINKIIKDKNILTYFNGNDIFNYPLSKDFSEIKKKTKFISFSHNIYQEQIQKLLVYDIEKQDILNTKSWTREKIKETELYEHYNKLFDDNQKKWGYNLWKPFIIFFELMNLNDGDILFYYNINNKFPEKRLNNSLLPFLYMIQYHYDIIGGTERHIKNNKNKNKFFTTKECYKIMSCEDLKFKEVNQIHPDFFFIIKNDFTIKIIKEWYDETVKYLVYKYNNELVHNDILIKDNLEISIWTNLCVKYNIPCLYIPSYTNDFNTEHYGKNLDKIFHKLPFSNFQNISI